MNTFRRMLMPALVVLSVLIGSLCVAVARAQSTAARGPAPTLVRPRSPTETPGADGFLQRWLILEPTRTTGQLTESAVQTAVTSGAVPDQLTAVPRDGDKVTVAGADLAWHAMDTVNYNVNLYHFAWALSKPTSNVLFWIVTVVNAPREMSGVRLAIGSNAASVWWVNGQEVIGLYNDRQTVIDDGVSKQLTLMKGANVVRAAIINGGGATDFCARFLNEQFAPITNLAVSTGSVPATGRGTAIRPPSAAGAPARQR